MFIQKAIETLLSDRDIRRAAHAELRATCEQVLDEIKALPANNNEVKAEKNKAASETVLPELTRPPGPYLPVERIFVPFELACGATRSPRLVASALDSIHKLVAYGHIRYSDVKTDNPDDVPDRAFDDHVVSTVANCFQGPQTDEGVQLQVLKGLLTIVTSNHIRVHENSLLLAIRTCYNIYLASRNLINQTTAKATLNQMLNCVFSCMESESLEEVIETKRQQEAAVAAVMNQAAAQQTQQQSSAVQQNGNGTASGEEQESSLYEIVYPIVDDLVSNLNLLSPSDENFKNLLQKDAFLVFRSLCKLSMKALPDGNPDPKSHELRSKILSLQLLLSILQNGGPAFQTNEIFVSAIKSYLCVALSQNGVSPIGEVFELSLAIFLSLLTKYRRHLKSQIEIFFKEICLNILEASSSSFEQKWVVVQGITSVCSEAQIVIDIYVNYDCDLAAANVFERLVDDLSKLAQGRHAFEIGSSQNQLMKIRVKGLDCLCTILKCMVEWSKDLYVNPHASKKSASDLNSSISVSEHDFVDSSLEPRTASDDPSQFEKVKQHKHILEHGLKLFSQKPRKGIKYFQEQGIIKNGGLAEFLTNENDRLDKGALGEYLGELENKEIMYHYIDQMNLVGLGFVSSLRFLLEGFRLPGEAQKIDRLMEKFASRYVECNPNQNIFKSADGAYVLAYSVIMLTTDLHSAHVKKKMTSEEFVKNNRGINDDEDLPKEYLSKIYEEIADNEIKVKPTGSNVGKRSLTQDQKTRNLIWSQESNTISQTAGALMESASSKKDVFTSARHLDHVKPMFKQIWSPLLATFSVGLQDSDDPAIAQLCIEGIRCAIRIANIFGFSMERNAFIQALARFTLLTDNSNVSEMKAKNIEAIKTLISVANSDGNYLETSWLEIMKSVSQLEFAQMLDNSQRPQQDPPASEAESNYRSSLSEANSQSVLVAVDRIFNGSKNLNGDAIVHFVAALCQVSCDEISHANPRMFSLVKVVEISYYNMERIRLEWSRIWQVLGNHFNLVGCNHSQDISLFAVDSLKQLSMKFLEKGELQNFHFQKDFLRPFEYIMKNNKSAHIRDMVVRCLSQMVQSQSSNIRSGWKNIFATFALAASDFEEPIVALSFQSAEGVVRSLIAERQLFDCFQDCVKCMSEFACNQFQLDIAMEAIHLIRQCAKFVHENTLDFCSSATAAALSPDGGTDEQAPSSFRGNNDVWVRGWFPVLFELSCIINRSKLDIRTRSLTILFDVVKQYGHSYESSWWKDLFSVLFRLFDVVKLDHKQNTREWMDTTCNHALYAMTDVFNEFFVKLSPILLADMFGQYKWCIVLQEHDQIAKSAVSCLENLVITNRNVMDEGTVHAVLQFLSELVLSTAHLRGTNRASIHLEVVNSVHRILFGVTLKNAGGASPSAEGSSNVFFGGAKCFDHLVSIIESLLESHEAAKALISSNKTSGSEMPMLVKQETHAVKCAFEILLELYHDKSTSAKQSDIEARFLRLLKERT